MELHNLQKQSGTKDRKRVGRGDGSGNGKTAGKGHKGQKARSGGGVRRGFEGGQMPIIRRLPKRGFNNKWSKNVAEINIKYFINVENGETIDPVTMLEMGLCKGNEDYVKIIGKMELKNAINIKAHKFTKGAKESIENAGGKAEEMNID
jgi:large subunit ribosomal protein L15